MHLMISAYGRLALNSLESEFGEHDWREESNQMGRDMASLIEKHGPFAQGDTRFATGHHAEERLVCFDLLTVTLDEIMRECGIPDEQREQQREEYRGFAEYFLEHYDGPEKTLPLLNE